MLRILAILLVLAVTACDSADRGLSPTAPEAAPEPPNSTQMTVSPSAPATMSAVVDGIAASAAAGGVPFRMYRGDNGWGTREDASLAHLGLVQGADWELHPVTDLAGGVPSGTDVVYLPPNAGTASFATAQNSAASQQAMVDFLGTGGVLIVDMGDNLNSPGQGYRAPGASGHPDYVFPDPSQCTIAKLASGSLGADGLLGTGDDHAWLAGADGVAGTSDDMNDARAGMDTGCWTAHGNLVDGITMPAEVEYLVTQDWHGTEKPVMAYYCHEGGTVVLSTFTSDFAGQAPSFGTWTYKLVSLFRAALDGGFLCDTNEAPVADAGADQIVECTGSTAVTLDGSASSDPDGDVLTFEWFDADGNQVATGVSPTLHLERGTHTFTLIVSDGALTTSDEVVVEVVDTTPPELSFTLDVTEIWPPNHEMVTVATGVSASDACDASPALAITVTSDEAVNGNGDGDTAPDWQVIDNGDGTFDVQVRAERSGTGDGRIYTITVTATDGSGNTTSASGEVAVPLDKGKKKGR